MDKSLWKTDDKAWMRQRKEEWKKVKYSLDEQGYIKKKNYKYHKELFLYGETDYRPLNKDGYTYDLPFSPGGVILYLLWYYPDDDQAVLDKLVMDTLLKDSGDNEVFAVGSARSMIFRLPTRGGCNGYNADYGMMGAREEKIVHALYPSFDYDEVIDTYKITETGVRLAPHPSGILNDLINHTLPLLTGYNKNIYSPGQYLWDHFDHNIDKIDPETIEKNADRLFTMIYIIKHWQEWDRFPDDNPHIVAMVKKLKARFDNREFGNTLMGYWDNIEDLYEQYRKKD